MRPVRSPARPWLGWGWLLCLGACGDADAAVPVHPSATPEVHAAADVRESSTEPPLRAHTAEPRPTVLWVAGDVLTTDALRDYARSVEDPGAGFARILEPVARYWRNDGFVLANLETPMAQERRNALAGDAWTDDQLAPRFLQAPEWLADGLALAGVDGVTLANNHAMDQEASGLMETIDASRRAGLAVLGAGRAPDHHWPLVLGDDGATMAVLALYDGRRQRYLDPGDPARAFLDDAAFERVAALDAEHDAVVVIVHVLGELRDHTRDRWEEWALRLVEVGADAIVVHGTHVVLPAAFIDHPHEDRTVPIAWGLGNFVTDMGRDARPWRRGRDLPKTQSPRVRESLLARVELRTHGELEMRFVSAWMNDDRYVRWRGGLTGGDVVEFELLPMRACPDPVDLPPAWPSALQTEMRDWITRSRDYVVRHTGLQPSSCDADPPWLWLH